MGKKIIPIEALVILSIGAIALAAFITRYSFL
jgi:hypothetical protein